jgi:phosphatidylserine/phosphatidylglycerophosphate/cardiolipin synthase-like enzyme
MDIDSDMIITGSFNFTKTAQEKQVENLLLIREQILAVQYTQNGEAHRQNNQPHVGRGDRQ